MKEFEDKTFYVMWTYAANYSRVMKVRAQTAARAAEVLLHGMSADFEKKGNVYVWDNPPIYTIEGGGR